MKILILVQSSLMPPFDKLFDTQLKTWDSGEIENVATAYYFSGNEFKLTQNFPFREDSYFLQVKCSPEYDMMHWRHKLALDEVWNWNWDFIFRTNASSYIDKALLYKRALSLKDEKCYMGIDGGGFASGCGVFLSRDVVEILKDTIDDYPTPSEDCNMGTILAKNGIEVTPGAERCDWYFGGDKFKFHYHYRCKSNTENRNKDTEAMQDIFHRINDTSGPIIHISHL